MSEVSAYQSVADILCRDGRQWFVDRFTPIPKAQVIAMLQARWPDEAELRRYVAAGGSFHFLGEGI